MNGRRVKSEGGLREVLRLVEPFTKGHRRQLSVMALLALMGAFAEAAVLVMIARLAFAVASGDERVRTTLGPLGEISIPMPALIGVAAALAGVRVALQFVQARVMTNTYAGVWSTIRTRIMRSYLDASWALQSEQRGGRLQELVTTFANGAASTVFQLSQGMVALLSLAAFIVTALFVNALAALAVTAAAIGIAVILRPLRGAIRRRARRSSVAGLAFATDVNELAGTMQEIRVFDVEPQILERINRRIQETARLDRRTRFLGQLTPAVYQGAALLLVIGVLGVVYAAGFSRLGSLGGIVLIMMRSLTYGQAAQSSYQALHAAAPGLEILRDEQRRYGEAAINRDGETLEHIGEIAFDDVSFEYTPGRAVLRGISFTVPQGEIIGIVGPSGAGKSTLVQLILRLRDPTGGSLRVDSRDVRELALGDWYRRVSFVPQDARMFAGSVAENIRFYRDDVDEAAIERAAKLANLHDEIISMVDGYHTSVGERGGHLSGGQQQRLCIARALAEEPDILVLDEPTSSLDVKSEALIREAIAGLAPRTTVFVIAHRLSTLDICDRIMVLHEGRLQGFDTPQRLEETDPFYREALRLSGMR